MAGLRERKKSKTREMIIDVAGRLFLLHGFDSVTLAQVADECEISERTILRYFATKEALALAREQDRLEQFRSGIARRDVDAVAFWRGFVAAGVERLVQGDMAAGFRAHLAMIFADKRLLSELLSLQHGFEDVLTAAINDDSNETNPLGARLLATVLVAGNGATVREWIAAHTQFDPRVLLDVVDYAATAFRIHDMPNADTAANRR